MLNKAWLATTFAKPYMLVDSRDYQISLCVGITQSMVTLNHNLKLNYTYVDTIKIVMPYE